MKNVYFVILLLISYGAKAQGVDLIILVDESYYVNNTEYWQGNSIAIAKNKMITQFLECNPANRVAIVHYKMVCGLSGSCGSQIYIKNTEEDNFTGFTNDLATALSYVGGVPIPWDMFTPGGADLHSAIGQVRTALHTPADQNAVIQAALVRSTTNALVVYAFRTGRRTNSSGGDYTVNRYSTAFNSNGAFENFTLLKNEEDATIMLTISPLNNDARKAAASVASVGGGYYGQIEGYPDDPEFSGTLPRYIMDVNDQNMTDEQVETVVNQICSIQKPCLDNIELVSPDNDWSELYMNNNQEAEITIIASNKLVGGTASIYHAGQQIVLKDGFYAAYLSEFHGYIEGCSGNFVARMGNFDQSERDVLSLTEASNDELSFFTLAPNPANSIVTITATEEMKSVTVTSQDGKTLYSRAMPDKTTSIDIPVSSYSDGIYTVTVTTANGKIQTQKLVKN